MRIGSNRSLAALTPNCKSRSRAMMVYARLRDSERRAKCSIHHQPGTGQPRLGDQVANVSLHVMGIFLGASVLGAYSEEPIPDQQFDCLMRVYFGGGSVKQQDHGFVHVKGWRLSVKQVQNVAQ